MAFSSFTHSRIARLLTLIMRSAAVFLIAIVSLQPNLTIADDFFVSVDGDDENVGTSTAPFRTVARGALALSPGDTLFVRPGLYEDEGTIFVRFVDEAFEFFPLVGDRKNVTRIVGLSEGKSRPIVLGTIDVRGAFINISGLTLRGTPAELGAGIGVFESHNINIRDCVVTGFGGGGIAFNQCDLVRAVGNEVGFNATTNPNQSSGISLFQSVVRTRSRRAYGAVILGNISVGNKNTVPASPDGKISDGNGIIADDFLYTQDTGILEDAVAGVESLGATGVPVIEFDADGTPLSYSRRTLIKGNITLLNGGRGVHAFLCDHVDIVANLSLFNLNSPDLTDGLPRDEDTGEAFFVFGEVNLTDCKDVLVSGNFAVSAQTDAAGGAEQFFDRIPQDAQSPNQFSKNVFRNIANQGRAVDVAGVESSSLQKQGRKTRRKIKRENAEKQGRAYTGVGEN